MDLLLHAATRDDIAGLRQEMNANNEKLRQEFKEEFGRFKQEVNEYTSNFRQEVKKNISTLQQDFKSHFKWILGTRHGVGATLISVMIARYTSKLILWLISKELGQIPELSIIY